MADIVISLCVAAGVAPVAFCASMGVWGSAARQLAVLHAVPAVQLAIVWSSAAEQLAVLRAVSAVQFAIV